MIFSVFFFTDTSTTDIHTLSLHDALPIYLALHDRPPAALGRRRVDPGRQRHPGRDVQGRTVGDQDEVAGAAEAQRIAVAPQRGPRRPRDRARVVTAGRIGDRRTGAFLKSPR